ncbi:MAG: 50S ribosomal protein L32 [Actinobacteria bacterium]|nr:50S ribosomal protein L32 [Actinomycetota bacterium]
MATPKRKTTRSKRDSRRAANWRTTPATYAECPQCHQSKLPHRVCTNCGYYAGRQAIEVE